MCVRRRPLQITSLSVPAPTRARSRPSPTKSKCSSKKKASTRCVADASCGAKHADASDASAACAKRCVARGDQAVLVTKEGKVYKIDSGSQTKAKEFVGKTVTVSGDVKDDTVTVASIK